MCSSTVSYFQCEKRSTEVMYPGPWFVWNPYMAWTHAHAILPVTRGMQLRNVGTRRRASIHYFGVAKCLPLVTSCLNFSPLYKLPCGTEWIILEPHTSLPQLLHPGVITMKLFVLQRQGKERKRNKEKKILTIIRDAINLPLSVLRHKINMTPFHF